MFVALGNSINMRESDDLMTCSREVKGIEHFLELKTEHNFLKNWPFMKKFTCFQKFHHS